MILKIHTFLKNKYPKIYMSIGKYGHISLNFFKIYTYSDIILQKFLIDLKSIVNITKHEIKNDFLNLWIDTNTILEPFKLTHKINVEYCSPNPTGPLHLGHARGTMLGDMIYKILNYINPNTINECYLNDQGNQIEKFIESVKYYKGLSENLYYQGDYIKDIAEKTNDYSKENLLEIMYKNIFNSLKDMNIKFVNIVKESSLLNDLKEVEEKLKPYLKLDSIIENGPKHIVFSLDDEKKVFQRNDGSYGYFAFDVAYLWNKKKRGFYEQIISLGEDHDGHFYFLKKVANILDINLRIFSVASVFLDGNKISKRQGILATFDDIFKNINPQVFKSILLDKSKDKKINITKLNLNIDPFIWINYYLNNLEFDDNAPMDHDIYKIIFYFPKTLEEFYTFLDPYKMFFIYKDLIKCLNKKEKLCTKLQTPIIDLLKFFKIIFI